MPLTVYQEHILEKYGDKTIYTHNKRKDHRYIILHKTTYADASPSYEGDKMLLCVELKPHSKSKFGSEIVWSGVINENSPDLNIRKNTCSFLYPGELQAKDPIMYGTEIVVYMNIVDGINWYRPSSEFFDGTRFIPLELKLSDLINDLDKNLKDIF